MRLIFFVLLCACTNLANAQPNCYKDTCFKDSVIVGSSTLPLKGIAKYTYWGFSIYTAAFYAADASRPLASETPRALVLHYHRDLERDDFIESSNKVLPRIPNVEIEKIQEELDSLYSFYGPVSSGDRYTLSYIPGEGTSLSLNGVLKGTVAGGEFAYAYFGLWLSDAGLDRDNWKKLLGNA